MPSINPAGPPGVSGGAQQGYSGGDYIITDNDPSLWGGVSRRRDVPSQHVVKQGDTLWEICDQYYGDPWSWPQLWAYNKSITNPHWIYPGDRIRLLGGSTPRRLDLDAGSERIRLTQERRTQTGPITFKQNAFVDAKELAEAGAVSGANVEKLLLSERDEIYIAQDDKLRPKVGKSYSIYRVRKKLENHNGDDLGYLVEIMGTTEVKRTPKGKHASAIITESVLPIERGNKVGPLRKRFKQLPVVPGDRNVDGFVVSGVRDKVLFASDEVVFVDLGKNHGVKNGNRLLVVRSGDARTRLLHMKNDSGGQWPREAVAEISVLDARDDVCVGLITRALKEVRLGDRVTLRKGY